MTSKLLSTASINSRLPFLLSIAALTTAFFVGTASAEGSSSTSLQSISSSSPAPAIQSITPTPTAECPLNSGGPSLLGTTWRLESIYGNRIPHPLEIDMRISTNALSGFSGCNKYSASFSQVGYTGFKVKKINQTKKACSVIIPYKKAKAVNVGNWEGSYLRTLRRMGSVRQAPSGKLHFFNRNGEIGMILRKIADENQPAAKKVVAPKAQPVIKKAAPVQQQQPAATPKAEAQEDAPVIRKINSNNDDITAVIKALGL